MDRAHFDTLTRAVAAHPTRRRFAGLLVAWGIGAGAGFDLLAACDAGAKRRKGKKRKRKKMLAPTSSPQPDPACVPACEGKFCGPDGCGGSCGQCHPNGACIEATGTCICAPCPSNHTCDDQGQCVCVPACFDKECGPDGCGGSCGSCPLPFYCGNGTCQLI